jgi:hypothetical protein
MKFLKKLNTFVAGFLTGTLLIYGWGYLFGTEATDIENKIVNSDKGDEETINADIKAFIKKPVDVKSDLTNSTENSSLSVEDQESGNSVLVKNIKMPNNGWIVIHEVKDGIIANALGAARRDSGEYDNVSVYLLRGTIPKGTYMVVLYKDNGDKTFDLSTDKPFAGANGEYIMSKFNTY